ncbi:MAG TPA: hypothetical protein VGR69_09440 [Candidatus Rubrimentiphilum sp.]|nr:hypothetical protein [Candidatus Rubrimentiphilum sp.]
MLRAFLLLTLVVTLGVSVAPLPQTAGSHIFIRLSTIRMAYLTRLRIFRPARRFWRSHTGTRHP